tara:strand:+ start:104 stop:313 length:210 start_codon:yes stop_codon:yes gene_type:complete
MKTLEQMAGKGDEIVCEKSRETVTSVHLKIRRTWINEENNGEHELHCIAESRRDRRSAARQFLERSPAL